MNSETKVYLTDLFATKPETDYILIWAKKGDTPKAPKISRWAQTVAEALKAVEAAESEPGWHVYAGVCPRPKSFGPKQRGTIADTSALLCFWLDIDIGTVGHKSQHNPETKAQALELLAKFPLPPSLIVHTGGGLHAYWLLKEAWLFDSAEVRAEAAGLMEAFQKAFGMYAVVLGYGVDPTFDLTRVLRIPGTTNWKGETPRQCAILEQSATRYDVSEIRDALPPEAFTPRTAKAEVSRQIAGLVLDPDATPPQDKFEALRLADPKFELSVKYQRRDFARGDYTPSGYDLSLASIAAYAGWNEQEIANLLIFVRKLHKQDSRIDDARYYVRTINLAMLDAQRKRAMDELRGDDAAGKIIDRPPTVEATEAKAPPDPEVKRKRILGEISKVFGCRIVGVIKYVQDPPRYRIETAKGGIELGTVENLIGQTQIRNALAAVDGHVIPKFGHADWVSIAQRFLDSCQLISTGPESTNRGAIKEWVNVYLDENPAGVLSEQSITNQQPHYDGDYVSFYLSHFKKWLYQRLNENKSARELGIMLRLIHARDGVVSYLPPDNSKRTTRAVWRVPKPGERRGEGTAETPETPGAETPGPETPGETGKAADSAPS